MRPIAGCAARLSLLSLLGALAACATAPSLETSWPERGAGRDVRIVVRYGPRDGEAARQVRRALRIALPIAERWGRLSAPLAITIHPTHAALEAAAGRPGHSWLRAWARPDRIELQSPRTWTRGQATDAELAQLLAHELTHCAMFQAVGGDAPVARSIPVWFREGMATTNAGERFAAACAPSTSGALTVTAAAYHADSARVYATADQAFRLLVRCYGEERIRGVLERMRGGITFEAAFSQAIGISVGDFEAEFRASLGSGTTAG